MGILPRGQSIDQPVREFPPEGDYYLIEHGVYRDAPYHDEPFELPYGADFELADLESYYEPDGDDRVAVAEGRTVVDFESHAAMVNEGTDFEMTEVEPIARDEPRGVIRKAKALALEPGVTMAKSSSSPTPGACHLMAVSAVAEGRAEWRPYIDGARRVVCLSGLSFAEACDVNAAANAARFDAEVAGLDGPEVDRLVYAAQRQALALVLSRREGGAA